MTKERIAQLYAKYRNEGGFGVYSVDRLCARNVSIPEKIYQEDTITELFNAVYYKDILKTQLEYYTGRKYTGASDRCSIQLKNGIPKECFVRGEDPFKIFSKRYRVHGYTNCLYWKEKYKDLERWNPKEVEYKGEEEDDEIEFSKPLMVRSTTSTNLFSTGIYNIQK
jgi:hypothetical protein